MKYEIITDQNKMDETLRQKYNNMVSRATRYCVKRRQSCYEDVTISEEWLGPEGYDHFKEYILETTGLYTCNGVMPHLDKDILSVPMEGKMYAPYRCLLVPRKINYLWETVDLSNMQELLSYDPVKMVYTIKVGKHKKTVQSKEEAVAYFCKIKDQQIQEIISQYSAEGLCDFAIKAMQSYDIYAHHGLIREDWI